MSSSKFTETWFLEPAHYHDPTQISNIAAIPESLLKVLPADAQKALWTILESTSVVYASYRRLQELSKERFHRLVPDKSQVHRTDAIVYSEPAFHNYVNSLQTEKAYFIEEAFIDWRHKAMRVDLCGHHDKKLHVNSRDMTAQRWWATLQDTVENWSEEVEDIDIPDFEETVQEYRVFQAKENRRNSAREERNQRRKTMLDLERPDFGEMLEKVNSAVIVD